MECNTNVASVIMGFGKDGKGVILRERSTITLGALAQFGAVIFASGIAITEDFRMLKALLQVNAHTLTSGEGEGLVFGIANGDLTAVEIAECLVTDGPIGPQEHAGGSEEAERAVHVIAASGLQDAGGTERTFLNENGGPMIEDKFPWTYYNGSGWDWFVFNNGSAALTTGGFVEVLATMYGVWVV